MATNLLGQFINTLGQTAQNIGRGASQFVQQLPQELYQETMAPGQIAQQVAPQAPITKVLQGDIPGAGKQIASTLSQQGAAIRRGDPQAMMELAMGTLGGEAPSEMGQYTRTAEGQLIKKVEPTLPKYAIDTSATEATGVQPPSPVQLPPITEPGVPTEGTPYPFAKQPTGISKLGKGQNQAVRQIRLSPAIGGAQEEGQINSTLDRLGFQGSAQDQYGQLQPKMQQLNDYVQSELSANPQFVNIDEIKNAFQDKLKSAFVAGEITKPAAQQEANSYITRLFSAASPTGSEIVPTTIDTPTLYTMKVMANEQARPLFKILDNGGTLTDTQKVILANRNALDDVIAKYHPNIKQATQDMSNLYDATPSLETARFKPPAKFSITQAALGEAGKFLPGQPLIDVGARMAASAAMNPVTRGLGLVGLGAAATQLPQLYKTLSQGHPTEAEQKAGQVTTGIHVDSVPQDVNTGHYTLPENPGVQPLTPGTPAYTRAENAMTGGSRQFMQNAPQYMTTVNTLQDDVKAGMPLDVLHQFKNIQALQSYMSNPSNPYAKQLADVGKLNSQFKSAYKAITGSDPADSQLLSPGDSEQQFSEKYKEMVKFIHDQYSQFQTPYLQTTEVPTTPNVPAGSPVQYAQPQQQQNVPASILQGALPSINLPQTSLPPIQ